MLLIFLVTPLVLSHVFSMVEGLSSQMFIIYLENILIHSQIYKKYGMTGVHRLLTIYIILHNGLGPQTPET